MAKRRKFEPGQITFWLEQGVPNRLMYLQADGQFRHIDEADDSGCPYSICGPEWQAKWPTIPPGVKYRPCPTGGGIAL